MLTHRFQGIGQAADNALGWAKIRHRSGPNQIDKIIWGTYLKVHDRWMTGWHIICAGLFIGCALAFYLIAGATMARNVKYLERWHSPSKHGMIQSEDQVLVLPSGFGIATITVNTKCDASGDDPKPGFVVQPKPELPIESFRVVASGFITIATVTLAKPAATFKVDPASSLSLNPDGNFYLQIQPSKPSGTFQIDTQPVPVTSGIDNPLQYLAPPSAHVGIASPKK